MDCYLGMIKLYPYGFAPRGWAICDGTMISPQQNAALFSLIGTVYGGDGRTTFALPDLRNACPTPGITSMMYYIATEGIYPSRPY